MTALSVAWAHAGPLTTSPTDGATVTALPAVVSMETSQAMRVGAGTSLVVVNSMGTQVTTAAATVDPANPKHISVPLPAGLPAGTYSVRWSTLSAEDGEVTDGSWSFTYAPAQTTATASPTPPATTAGTAAPTVTVTASGTPVATTATRPPVTAVTPSAPNTGMGRSASQGSGPAAMGLLVVAAVALSLGARLTVGRPSDR